ncbi:2-oxoglutarate dehydrogenase, E2 component, dihydrolipoamide succinyltransferase [Nocardioides sp. T5]|uniref:2-oxoglutarate dehydrogenase, E2 component, dihydrolipoamide succinyltransferase n=1 Tax=Nocardioides sp. T5 TaxID=3400182 RepID=UPI003A84A8ED
MIGSGDASGGSSEPQSAEAQPKDDANAEKKAEQEEQIAEDKGEPSRRRRDPESDKQDSPAASQESEKPKETEQPKEAEPEAKGDAPYAPAPASSGGSTGSSEGGRDQSAYVTPLVRKMADQHGVDLGSVQGTGVGGRIRKQDVLDAAAAAQQAAAAPAAAAPAAAPAAAGAPPAAAAPSTASPSPLRGTTEPLSRLRKVIASRMVESLHESAQLTQVMEVDVTAIARLREASKADFLAREGVKLTYLPFFAKAAIDALKLHPKLNAAIDSDKGEVTYYDRENIAFAVDTEKGLLTPVVKEAGDLSIAGLAKKIADVAERTRTNKITPDELSGGTFTITNLGSFGALFDTPIINKPQVAILGPGAVVKRPVVIDDPNLGETIAVRHMVHLSLTYDHRLVDGADAGRFLQEVKKRLEAGQFEV